MPNREHTFARNEVAPSYWANALQAFLSVGHHQFALTLANSTTVQVVASAGDGLVAIAINGSFRYNEVTVNRAHPGGASGTYDVYVTASAQSIASTPQPYTDNTNRAFALAIVATGSTPAIIPGTVDIYRKVGTLTWSGTAITRVTPTVGAGQGAISGVVVFDGDATANLYRPSAGIIRTDGSLQAASVATYQPAAQVAFSNRLLVADANAAFQVFGDGRLQWGPGGASAIDTNLYRAGAGQLTTDGSIRSAGFRVASGNSLISDGYLQISSGAANEQIMFNATANAIERARFTAVGDLVFGPTYKIGWSAVAGTGAADTNLYRAAAGALQTDGEFDAASYVQANRLTANRVALGYSAGLASPGISFGSALDTNLYRTAAGVLRTDGAVQANQSAVGNVYFGGLIAGEPNYRFRVTGDGAISIGPGGAVAPDTNLYRASAGVLRTDGSLVAGSTAPVTNSLLSAVAAGNGIEFGHTNAAGYRNVLGGQVGDGRGFLAFNAEAGSVTSNTYRTRGVLGSIIRSDLVGGVEVGTVGLATGDNQAMVVAASVSAAGMVQSNAAAGSAAFSVANGAVPFGIFPRASDALGNTADFRWGDGTGYFLGFAPRVGAKAGLRTFAINDLGQMFWFDPATGLRDTNVDLYRSVANTLRTDGNFVAGGTLTVSGTLTQGTQDPIAGIPIGAVIPYAGTTLPPGGQFLWADGTLINRTIYATFHARAGFAYNGGADPGSGTPQQGTATVGLLTRLPDKRGRVSVGANNFGQGASGRLTANNALGQSSGAESVALTSNTQNAVHAHATSDPGHSHSYDASHDVNGGFAAAAYGSGGFTNQTNGSGTGIGIQNSVGGSSHGNMQPYEIDNYIVRVA